MYSDESVSRLHLQRIKLQMDLLDVSGKTLMEAQPHRDTAPRVYEHLTFGVARRMGVIRHSLHRVFGLFPPDAKQRLADDDLADVTVCLHAFLLNIAAIFDNWAWAYLLRHGLGDRMDKRKIGLFIGATQQHLPKPVRDYLQSDRISTWHNESVKTYRDATAHRIPPYIPPAWVTEAQARELERLTGDWNTNTARGDFDRAGAAMDQIHELGGPAFVFCHASSDGSSCTVPFHQQMLSDVGVVAEFALLFVSHWAEPPTIAANAASAPSA